VQLQLTRDNTDVDMNSYGARLWLSTETRVIWHAEGGKGQVPQMAHFQLRPDPLAK
jgi:hypothetical protein